MMQQGEKYQCTNEDCGCQISVTKGSEIDDADAENPTCCCGEEMELMTGAKSASERTGSGSSRSRTTRS